MGKLQLQIPFVVLEAEAFARRLAEGSESLPAGMPKTVKLSRQNDSQATVQLFWTGGFYATVSMTNHRSNYGVHWTPTSAKLKFPRKTVATVHIPSRRLTWVATDGNPAWEPNPTVSLEDGVSTR